MTLWKDDPDRMRKKRAERHEHRAGIDAKRPWLFPLIVVVAVAAIAFVLVVSFVSGQGL